MHVLQPAKAQHATVLTRGRTPAVALDEAALIRPHLQFGPQLSKRRAVGCWSLGAASFLRSLPGLEKARAHGSNRAKAPAHGIFLTYLQRFVDWSLMAGKQPTPPYSRAGASEPFRCQQCLGVSVDWQQVQQHGPASSKKKMSLATAGHLGM